MADANKKQEILNERKNQKAARKAEAHKKAKRANITKIAMTTFVIVILVLAAVLFAYKQIVVSGVIERHATAISSENYSISNSMMTYYFNSTYQNFASYGQQMGLDTSKSLKEQSVYEGMTWYDYILGQAENQANQFLVLKEGARAEGFTLNDSDYEEADEIIDNIKSQATEYGYTSVNSFIKMVYGSCVNLSDVKKCVEMGIFAEKYADELMERGEYSAEDYEKYFGEHSDSYQYIDYLKYSFDAEKDETTGEISEDEAAEMKSHAEALAALTTVDEFKSYVREYETEKKTAELAEGETLDEAAIEAAVEGALITHNAKSSLPQSVAEALYDDSNPVGFVATENDDENSSHTVYMKASDKYKDEYTVRSAQTIFISNSSHTDETGASAFAEEVMAKWEETDKTAESFEALAEEYNEGTHSHGAQVVKKTAGTYTDWLYDESRTEGDVESIVSESDKGVYIVYYAGEEELTAWEYDVDSALRSEYYNEVYSSFAADHWVYKNEDNLSKISPISLKSN